jgi:exopolysaccharide biosynthesis polyprenyl glycosylphosphotransferase
MPKIHNLQLSKPISFHVAALNFIYVLLLVICHFLFPYIHELVFSFFNGLFLIVSITVFYFTNAVLRTSSITHFSYYSLIFRIIISILFFSLSIIFISFITNTTEIIKRSEFLSFLIYLFIFTLTSMILVKYFYSMIKPKDKSIFILLTDNVKASEQVSIYLADNSKKDIKIFNINEIESLINFAVNHGVEGVYISIDTQNLNSLEALVKDLSIYAFDLYWILPQSFFADSSKSFRIKPVLLNGSPVSLDSNQYLLKRSLDVIGSLFILLLVSPLFILVACIIKISDGGPIFYRNIRHGQYGREFNMLKFRSMDVGSDYFDQHVTHDDHRVTLIGRIIRKTSFDEIPQLLNILRGEMSLVGPRPHIISDTDKYSKKIIYFLSRHQVKPGLTGLAQIRTRGKTSTLELMQEKLESDLEYINQWTLYLDLKILFSTPLSLWRNRNTNI